MLNRMCSSRSWMRITMRSSITGQEGCSWPLARCLPTGKNRQPSSARPTCIAIPGMWMPETVLVAAGEGAPEGDVFDEEKARRDATDNFALAWLNWQKLAASIDWRQQECSKNVLAQDSTIVRSWPQRWTVP
jgi:hypothetical protein